MAKYFSYHISLCFFIFSVLDFSYSLRTGECEVCVKVVNQLIDSLTVTQRSSVHEIEARFMDFCSTSKKVENRFCYYIGGLEESATKIVSELAKPVSWGLPAEKVCEKLKKMDAQVCELRYEVVIDLKSVDLKKLKVKDLKKILSDWDERCDGCIEKPDFIKRIEELKPIHMKEEL